MRARKGKRIIEVSASGIDEALQGLTSSPSATAFPTTAGLRVPPVLQGNGEGAFPLQPRYLFCLATLSLDHGRLLGIRQGLTIGLNAQVTNPPVRPMEMEVTTPTFHFVDGNVSWHLVQEKAQPMPVQAPTSDSANWIHSQSQGPALLYDTATFAAGTFNPTTGAPFFYTVGLKAYSPPQVIGNWTDLCGLGNFSDIRFPHRSSRSWAALDVEFENRVSLYASVLQTNPVTRLAPSAYPGAGNPQANFTSASPEEGFIAAWQGLNGPSFEPTIMGPAYYRIFGSLIVEVDT